ncbi:MAG: hypothetical protein PHE50_04195 [Dehalococcoidales bacterium]|nr:hypothetical protein [Dehalococcoidales bacterium]
MKNIDRHVQEILEFAISIVWLGAAFGIALAGGLEALLNPSNIKTIVIESIIVVFFAFVLHELAHRILARRYGFHAVYHMWVPGLFFAIIGALAGFILAAPGGVQLEFQGNTTDNLKKMGKIALVGPVINMVLAVVFLGLAFLFVNHFNAQIVAGASLAQYLPTLDIIWGVLVIGIEINAWLAVFNLLPFGNFDGYKVFAWSKKAWIISIVLAVGLYIFMVWAQGKL